MLKRDYDPYIELAYEIVSQMCEDYIKSCKVIHKYGNRADITKSQYDRLMKAYKHRDEDIAFFKSDRPKYFTGVEGKFILNTLNERLKRWLK